MIDARFEGDNFLICENCSSKMHELKCKAICKKCGNYRSCSDLTNGE